jgi:hypothetical protein
MKFETFQRTHFVRFLQIRRIVIYVILTLFNLKHYDVILRRVLHDSTSSMLKTSKTNPTLGSVFCLQNA